MISETKSIAGKRFFLLHGMYLMKRESGMVLNATSPMYIAQTIKAIATKEEKK